MSADGSPRCTLLVWPVFVAGGLQLALLAQLVSWLRR